jgi:hypothetical protein
MWHVKACIDGAAPVATKGNAVRSISLFEEDAAADWTAAFLKEPSVSQLAGGLAHAQNAKELDDRQATAVFCTAELLAAAAGKPHARLPSALQAWVGGAVKELESLRGAVHRVFARARDESELSETWGDDPAWAQYVSDLEVRMGAKK